MYKVNQTLQSDNNLINNSNNIIKGSVARAYNLRGNRGGTKEYIDEDKCDCFLIFQYKYTQISFWRVKM